MTHCVSRYFTTQSLKQPVETMWEKEKMLVTSIFPLTTVFSTLSRREIIILQTFDLSSANALNLVKSKNLPFGKELKEWLLQILE